MFSPLIFLGKFWKLPLRTKQNFLSCTDFGKFFKEYIEPLIPSLAANALVMIAQMVVPQFLSSAPTSVPQPGTPGGGVSPSATPTNPIAISGKMLQIILFCFQK